MIVGIGCDLCDIGRMKKLLQDERFLDRYFAPEEKQYILDRGHTAPSSLAANFAAKEALVKALGTGFTEGRLSDICVLHDHMGKPYFDLRGEIAAHVSQLNVTTIHLSLSHEQDTAIAFVVAERNP